MANDNRRYWPKVSLPGDLLSLLSMIARAKGYSDESLHLFIYQLLKEAHPDDVERLTDYLYTRKYDQPPPNPPPE